MGNRILYGSILSSADIDCLTWFQEVFFYRLIVSVDDYGCLDARPILLRNTLFPSRDNVPVSDVQEALDALTALGMVLRYTCQGRPYLHLTGWESRQKLRRPRHIYPTPEQADPPAMDSAGQAPASGGQVTADGGQVAADGGQVAADGGQVTADGGQVAADGGQVAADGGQVAADGCQVAADVRPESESESESKSKSESKSESVSETRAEARRPPAGRVQTRQGSVGEKHPEDISRFGSRAPPISRQRTCKPTPSLL